MKWIKIENTWLWRSHQPVIHLAMSFFKPQYVLELGTGLWSTPIFMQYKPERFVTVENDRDWLEFVLSVFRLPKEYSAVYHDLGDININVNIKDLTVDQKNKLIGYYNVFARGVRIEKEYPKLLFVDQFASCRTISIICMLNDFDILIYHDSEQEGIDYYGYKFPVELTDMYNQYTFRSYDKNTKLMVRKTLEYDESELIAEIQPFILNFVKYEKLEKSKFSFVKDE